jgi:hypothetical protein
MSGARTTKSRSTILIAFAYYEGCGITVLSLTALPPH